MKFWPFALKFLLGCGVALLLLVSATVVSYKWHDAQLVQLQNELRQLPHPANSAFLAEHGKIANFGNGDHLDYWAVQLRALKGARGVLKTTYGTARVPVPNQGADADDDAWQGIVNGKQPVEWKLLPSPLPAHYNLKFNNSGTWDLSRFAGQQGLYVIQVVNSGGEASLNSLDWRGI